MKKEFHHVGMPSTTQLPGEIHLPDLDVYITDAGAQEHKVEWCRFGPKCKLPEVLSRKAHVAYSVENLEEALVGRDVIFKPCSPFPGLRIAFINDNGAPVEFLEFKK